MSGAKSITASAAYGALEDGISGATVFQDVPDGFTGPMVVIGPMDSKPVGGSGDPDRYVSLTIVSMWQGDENAPVLGLQEQVERILDGKILRPAGWKLEFQFLDDNVELDTDGVTYVGTTQFHVVALTDD